MRKDEIKDFLDFKVQEFNNESFIEDDPISIPKRYSVRQDIEIAGFIAAMFSWGQRVTILNKSNLFLELMDNDPLNFIKNHTDRDRERFKLFKHRTFQPIDANYFLVALQHIYNQFESLEEAFVLNQTKNVQVEECLKNFHNLFFSIEGAPKRTKKHVSTPASKSTCKRLNMFLRWMVRKDDCGVDFGIWNKIPMSSLKIPYDVHVDRVARRLNLVNRKQKDWKTVLELSETLLKFDSKDPIKYDFALYGFGVLESKTLVS